VKQPKEILSEGFHTIKMAMIYIYTIALLTDLFTDHEIFIPLFFAEVGHAVKLTLLASVGVVCHAGISYIKHQPK